MDNMILDIVGRESPTVEGLDIGETGNHVPTVQMIHEENESFEIPDSFPHKKIQKSKRHTQMYESDEIPYSKKLKDELIEITVYKTKLEALKLERELGLLPSTLTSAISKGPITYE